MADAGDILRHPIVRNLWFGDSVSYNLIMMDIQTSLQEISALLAGRVAELLANAAKDQAPDVRLKILTMIEHDLPTVITNTILKTPTLHSAGGVDHLKANLEAYAHQFAQRFIHNSQ
jgi:hypothetical protein